MEVTPIPREFVYEYADVYRPPEQPAYNEPADLGPDSHPSDLRCLDALK